VEPKEAVNSMTDAEAADSNDFRFSTQIEKNGKTKITEKNLFLEKEKKSFAIDRQVWNVRTEYFKIRRD